MLAAWMYINIKDLKKIVQLLTGSIVLLDSVNRAIHSDLHSKRVCQLFNNKALLLMCLEVALIKPLLLVFTECPEPCYDL